MIERRRHKTSGGYKYGTKGKLYKGQDARVKAQRQGRAIQASKARAKRGKPDAKIEDFSSLDVGDANL